MDDVPALRPAQLRGRIAPCRECGECPDFLSGHEWSEECQAVRLP